MASARHRYPLDRDLVAFAQGGDVASLGVLLERHRPVLLAAALAALRDAPRAHDAVQETCLVALRRIGDVRDPDAVGPWLHSVLRNVCRELWRAQRRAPVVSLEAARDAELVAGEASVADAVERAALGGWLWAAIAELPEPMRATAMLRSFGTWSSYDEIAAILGIPVGTVRSRLSHARERLAATLLETADAAGSAARELSREQAACFEGALQSMNAGTSCEALADVFDEDVVAEFSGGDRHHGRAVVRASLEDDMRAGVRMQPTAVFASGSVTVLEAILLNPPETPDRCPPATCQVHFRPGGRTTHVRLFFAARGAKSGDVPAVAGR